MSKGTLRIYGCGGTGINIASKYIGSSPRDGFADIEVGLFDTSDSNVTEENSELCHLVRGKEGSGKVRSDNAQVIIANTPSFLEANPPGDFNIVVFSGGGGTGSVAGPVIMQELLNRNIPCIAFMVGVKECLRTAKNNFASLETLENMASIAESPFVVSYNENCVETPRSKVDARIVDQIAAIAMLCSRNNDELDARDLLNWVMFNRATEVEPQLALLDVCSSVEDAQKIEAPISIASVLTNRDGLVNGLSADYSCIGYREGGLPSGMEECHFVISLDGLDAIYEAASEDVARREQASKARVATSNRPKARGQNGKTAGLVF